MQGRRVGLDEQLRPRSHTIAHSAARPLGVGVQNSVLTKRQVCTPVCDRHSTVACPKQHRHPFYKGILFY